MKGRSEQEPTRLRSPPQPSISTPKWCASSPGECSCFTCAIPSAHRPGDRSPRTRARSASLGVISPSSLKLPISSEGELADRPIDIAAVRSAYVLEQASPNETAGARDRGRQKLQPPEIYASPRIAARAELRRGRTLRRQQRRQSQAGPNRREGAAEPDLPVGQSHPVDRRSRDPGVHERDAGSTIDPGLLGRTLAAASQISGTTTRIPTIGS